MYERLNKSHGNALGFRITQPLDQNEMRRLTAELEGSIIAKQKIKVLIDLQAFPYADLGAFWSDLKFDLKYSDAIQRLAVVGGSQIEQWSIRVFSNLTSTKCRCFGPGQLENAWTWLTEE